MAIEGRRFFQRKRGMQEVQQSSSLPTEAHYVEARPFSQPVSQDLNPEIATQVRGLPQVRHDLHDEQKPRLVETVRDKPYDIAKAQQRLAEIPRELKESHIEIGQGQLTRSVRSRDDLRPLPFWRQWYSLWGADVVTKGYEDGSWKQFVDRHHGRFLFWKTNTRPGVYEETYEKNERGKLEYRGRKQIFEAEHIIDPGDGNYYISTKKTRELEAEEQTLKEKIHKKQVVDQFGVLGAFLQEGIIPDDSKMSEIEKKQLQTRLNQEITLHLNQSTYQKQSARPNTYTPLSPIDRLKLTRDTFFEIFKHHQGLKGEVRNIRNAAGTLLLFDTWFLMPIPLIAKVGITAAAIVPFGIYSAVNRIINREKINQKQQDAILKRKQYEARLGQEFTQFQESHKDLSLPEQLRALLDNFYLERNQDRADMMRAKNPNITKNELIAKLQRNEGLRQLPVIFALLGITVASTLLLGITSELIAGVSLGAAFFGAIGQLTSSFPNITSYYFKDMQAIASALGIPAQWAVTVGSTALLAAFAAPRAVIMRISNAFVRARKNIELKKEAKANSQKRKEIRVH